LRRPASQQLPWTQFHKNQKIMTLNQVFQSAEFAVENFTNEAEPECAALIFVRDGVPWLASAHSKERVIAMFADICGTMDIDFSLLSMRQAEGKK
jgi:hypothetical protein